VDLVVGRLERGLGARVYLDSNEFLWVLRACRTAYSSSSGADIKDPPVPDVALNLSECPVVARPVGRLENISLFRGGFEWEVEGANHGNFGAPTGKFIE
jgi:hypothetical protein